MATDETLGSWLRQKRTEKELGLREAAARAGITHGYLSQLESEKVKEPAPQVLQKLADAYDEPFILLMQVAGYIEDDPARLSPNQERALKIVGEPTDSELKAIRAVLNAIRSSGASFPVFAQLDGHLGDHDRAEIRGHAVAVLRRADALGQIPTPLDQAMDVSGLVLAGEIVLEPEMKKRLRERFGDLVDRAMDLILGSVRFDDHSVYLKPDLHWSRKRFVQAHEISHQMFPWHRDLYGFLDDEQRLRPDIYDRYERQANQGAIEILAQGDALRREADDSLVTFGLINGLAGRFAISLQATARRVTEESKQEIALAICYKGRTTGKLMAPHMYCSKSFDERFRWQAAGRGQITVRSLINIARIDQIPEQILEPDVRGQLTTMGVEQIQTPQAVFLLFRPLLAKPKLRTLIAARF
jgi:transcriptional regulator with XRE-family HTH domain/Zn-dependent peptidase ImmA (M78 family)